MCRIVDLDRIILFFMFKKNYNRNFTTFFHTEVLSFFQSWCHASVSSHKRRCPRLARVVCSDYPAICDGQNITEYGVLHFVAGGRHMPWTGPLETKAIARGWKLWVLPSVVSNYQALLDIIFLKCMRNFDFQLLGSWKVTKPRYFECLLSVWS